MYSKHLDIAAPICFVLQLCSALPQQSHLLLPTIPTVLCLLVPQQADEVYVKSVYLNLFGWKGGHDVHETF
jgi:hypothetical protein